MLACGLGAVLVLWLLVFGNDGGALEGERPLGSGEIRIRQFGTAHLVGFELDGYGFTSYSHQNSLGKIDTNVNNFDPRSSFSTKCSSAGLGAHFSALFRKTGGISEIEVDCKASDAFAKEVSIRFSEMTGPADVSLYLVSCNQGDEVHYIEIQTVDRRGVNEARYVFHCVGAADSALKEVPPDSKKWLVNFRQQVQGEISAMCPTDGWAPPFRYRVYDCSANVPLNLAVAFSGDGAVKFVEPNPSGPPALLNTINGSNISERIVHWSGGSFGSNRPPSLPACP